MADMATKTCARCRLELDVSHFTRKRENQLQSYCRTCMALANRESYARNHDAKLAYAREYGARERERLRRQVFDHYGGCCACCGEDHWVMLTIDHVDGDGAAHREEVTGSKRRAGVKFARWVIRNGFPPNIQILCWNCNMGKHYNGGVCPHASLIKP